MGLANPWTGTFKLGPDGAIDLHAEAYELSGRGTSAAYLGGDVRAIYKLEPSAEGDRLTICFPTHADAARPTTFTAADDVRVVSFIHVGDTFPDWPKDVTVTVLDPSGKPAVGASVFNYASRSRAGKYDASIKAVVIDMKSPLTWGYSDLATTGPDGTVTLPYTAFENASGVPSAAHDTARGWAGFAHVSPAALRTGKLTIQVQPTRLVRGSITSDLLLKAGGKLPWCAAYVFPADNNRTFWSEASDGTFEFVLPPGTYDLDTYGNDLKTRHESITVPAGEGEFTLPPISLEPTKILSLVGRPPPPLRGVVAWKGQPVDLASLKGKVVLVNFWGYWCGGCVAEMPQVMRIAEKYKDRGLVVVGIHADFGDGIDTVAKLDAKTAGYRSGIWHGKDLPFPTALVCDAPGQRRVSDDFGVTYFPSTVVIGREGRVLGLSGTQVDLNLNCDDEKLIDASIERLLSAK